MAILVNRDTRILIQGMTGRSGMQVVGELLDYGMKVVAGVTPGKGGQEVNDVPVFNSIKEAVDAVGPFDVSMVYVPPLLARDAAIEAIDAKIPLVHIFVEKIPMFDVARVLAKARQNDVRILGPSSVGAISPGEGKIGSIGGPNPNSVFSKGPIGVISKSGGMCSELAMLISNAGFGQSTVVGIGGDLLAGTSFAQILSMFEDDRETKAVVAFGEVGGSAEIEAAKLIVEKKFTKPFIIFLAGKFAEKLPKDTALGHAGAIVGLEATMNEKVKILKQSGAILAENFEDIPKIIKKIIG
ncbi:MAG: Succinyl-CoA synthetase alpha chain [Candidatus Curtissbacteria bacterium GW2011_GWA1_40_16]|uniref:Succinyl-CoA synthetase alpha chain n=1 Tax=Candidatus Curtissbacteria bacterium GW2011_GWA1_40_16 TaxID=1618405 RepID=A0A0G0R719_9BACT|nr:MAG: Succinyl-CoA synthetase alpha chain [Candidatus Curtissbacteria bacterium GW2011_GWA1_40_16]